MMNWASKTWHILIYGSDDLFGLNSVDKLSDTIYHLLSTTVIIASYFHISMVK